MFLVKRKLLGFTNQIVICAGMLNTDEVKHLSHTHMHTEKAPVTHWGTGQINPQGEVLGTG